MKHRDKVKLARSLLTNEELKSKTPKFESKAWIKRTQEIKKRVIEDGKSLREDRNK